MARSNRKARTVRKSRPAKVVVKRGITFTFSIGGGRKVRVRGLYSGDTFKMLKAALDHNDLAVDSISKF